MARVWGLRVDVGGEGVEVPLDVLIISHCDVSSFNPRFTLSYSTKINTATNGDKQPQE
jgi:hypothetical protein